MGFFSVYAPSRRSVDLMAVVIHSYAACFHSLYFIAFSLQTLSSAFLLHIAALHSRNACMEMM